MVIFKLVFLRKNKSKIHTTCFTVSFFQINDWMNNWENDFRANSVATLRLFLATHLSIIREEYSHLVFLLTKKEFAPISFSTLKKNNAFWKSNHEENKWWQVFFQRIRSSRLLTVVVLFDKRASLFPCMPHFIQEWIVNGSISHFDERFI